MRDKIENEYLIDALKIGVSYKDFWHMNPHILNLQFKAWNEKQKHLDEMMWTMGLYITHGISTIGKGHYPNKPFSQENFMLEENPEEMSEDKKNKQLEMLFASLDVLGRNANLANKRKKEQENGDSTD